MFGYSLNYLIDLANAIIVDVEATPTRISKEVDATETRSCREDGGNWHGAGPERHGGRDQAARSRSRGERSRVGQPSTRRMVI